MWLKRIYLRFPPRSTYHKFSCSLCSNNQAELVISKLTEPSKVYISSSCSWFWMRTNYVLTSVTHNISCGCQDPLAYGVYTGEQRFRSELFFLANAVLSIYWHPSIDSFILDRSSFVSSRYFKKSFFTLEDFHPWIQVLKNLFTGWGRRFKIS